MAVTTVDITTSAGNVYVSNGNSAVTWCSFANYDGSNVTITVNVVPNGDIASNTNSVLNTLEITAGDTYQMYAAGEKLLLEDGDRIVALANANSRVSAVVSYTSI